MAEHKHAKVLRAIADGKTVQRKHKVGNPEGKWSDVKDLKTENPIRLPDYEWRVKPALNTAKGWVNVYSKPINHFGSIYSTKEQAVERAGDDYVDTIEISHTWEEDNASGCQ